MIPLNAVRIGISAKAGFKRKVAFTGNSAKTATRPGKHCLCQIVGRAMEEDSSRSFHKRLRDERDDDAEEEGRIAMEGMIAERMEGGLSFVSRRQ